MKQEGMFFTDGIVPPFRKIDEGNRLTFPVKSESKTGDKVFLYDDGKCICVYEEKVYENIKNEIILNGSSLDFDILTAFTIHDFTLDKYNRITLPPCLVEKYRLHEGVSFEGKNIYFSIWNCNDFINHRNELDEKRKVRRKW